MSLKVAMAGGGTGGHVFPGLAVAEALDDAQCLWIGARGGLEEQLVPARGLKLFTLPFQAVRGKGWLRALHAPWSLLRSTLWAWRLLRQHQIEVVLALGGYAALPAGLAARLAGCRLVVHEQNAIAGRSNRLLALLAHRVLTGFPNVLSGKRTRYIGNPVRKSLWAVPPPSALGGRPWHLLVMGGSRGARFLNQHVAEALALWPAEQRPQVLHQCGRADLETTTAVYQRLGVEAQVHSFIDDVPQALGWADVVLARAGALTVAELAAAGRASVLVPFPFAVDDHQSANAQFLVHAQAASVLQQRDYRAELLRQLLQQAHDHAVLWGHNARSAAKPEAVSDLVAAVRGF